MEKCFRCFTFVSSNQYLAMGTEINSFCVHYEFINGKKVVINDGAEGYKSVPNFERLFQVQVQVHV